MEPSSSELGLGSRQPLAVQTVQMRRQPQRPLVVACVIAVPLVLAAAVVLLGNSPGQSTTDQLRQPESMSTLHPQCSRPYTTLGGGADRAASVSSSSGQQQHDDGTGRETTACAVRNLAEGRLARQSSQGYGGEPGRAVDGNTNDQFISGRSCTHTENGGEQPEWWQVDLGSAANVISVRLTNRQDCCEQRLGGVHVYVSETSDYRTYGTLCGTVSPHATTPESEAQIELSCGGAVRKTPFLIHCVLKAIPLPRQARDKHRGKVETKGRFSQVARFVTVVHGRAGKFLTLCEVEVFGPTCRDSGAEDSFLRCHFRLKAEYLPRQARDKYRKS